MDDMLIYLVKVSVGMILLYGMYVLLMKRETYFRLNRGYLLMTAILATIAPLISFPAFSPGPDSEVVNVVKSIQLNPAVIFAEDTGTAPLSVLSLIYAGGVIFFGIIFLLKISRIIIIHKQCQFENINGLRIGWSKKEIAPFSFLNTVYICVKTEKNDFLDKILVHEKVHIKQRHSIDVLFTEILCILTWFNPVSWMIKSALKETHEYLADSGVSEQTTDKAGYFQLLLSHVIGVQPGLANNFNKSLTLKRLKMMTKPRSGRLSQLKVLLVIPLAIALLSAFSISSSTDGLKLINSSANQIIEKADNPTDQNTVIPADKMPEFVGGQQAMIDFLVKNIKYPKECMEKGTQGKVYVSFVVSSTGKVTSAKVIKAVDPLLDKEALRVILAMPNWIPGEKDGVKVEAEMTLPIQFKLAEK